MNICVFSSSSNAINEVYFQQAQRLGELIAKGKHTLVNGGANVGLMEAITVAANNAGAHSIGVIPEKLVARSLASDNHHEVIIAVDMMHRKDKMREISDAFIALPGGFGTLEEILEVITLRQLSYHSKPIVFINTNGFFNHLIKHFEVSYREMFAKEVYRDLYYVANDAEDALKHIMEYVPVELDTKWFEVPTTKSS